MNGLITKQSAAVKYGFFISITLICSVYLLYQFLAIPIGALTADEFVFARHIYEYTYNLPYRDFSPYKTTLGYYLLSIPLYFSHDVLTPLFLLKNQIVLINTICIGISAFWATKIFDKRATALALLVIVANQIFFVYGSDLRVDMLTSWLCLFSLFAILQQRPTLAGTLLGLSFLISQKAFWYITAINAGFFFCWLLIQNTNYNLRTFLKFNASILGVVAIYILVWSYLSDLKTVISNLFYDAYIQAGINYYSGIYLKCWQTVLQHGGLLFLLWPIAYITLFESTSDATTKQKHIFITVTGTVAMLQFIHYKQAFPYNFVFTIPALFIMYADFLSSLFQSREKKSAPNLSAVMITTIHGILIAAFVYGFKLTQSNYVCALIPLSVYFIYTQQLPYKQNRISRIALLMLTILLGVISPLLTSMQLTLIDGRYQQTMIRLTNELLATDSDYVGGTPFLYNKDQPISGMKNLISPAIDYLSKPSEELGILMLPSIYLTRTTPEQIIADFEKSNVKVILNNYRIESLPQSIKSYLADHYQHYYGSIYLYAPRIAPNQFSFYLKFSGRYKVIAHQSLRLDNKTIHPQQIIVLLRGNHINDARKPYRLVLQPEIQVESLSTAFKKDDYLKMNKAIVV